MNKIIRLFPFVWLLGLTPIVHVLAAWHLGRTGVRSSRYGESPLIPVMTIGLGFYCVYYLLSIFVNSDFDFDARFLGALYNLSLCVAGFFIFCFTVNNSSHDQAAQKRLGCSALYLLILIFVIGIPILLLFGDELLLQFPSFLGLFIDLSSLPPHAQASASLTFIVPDWGDIETVGRLSVLAPYSNALSGTVIALSAIAAMTRNYRLCFISSVISLLLVVATRSRLAIVIAATVLLGAIFFYFLIRRRLEYVVFGICLIFLLLLCTFFFNFGDFLFIERSSSDELRGALYSTSFNLAVDQSPLLGFGIKPRLESFEMPLGSHSTYVGIIYKTGLVGALLGGVFFLCLSFFCVKCMVDNIQAHDFYKVYIALSVLGMIVFFAFEDIDAPQFLSVLFFYLAGCVVSDFNDKGAAT